MRVRVSSSVVGLALALIMSLFAGARAEAQTAVSGTCKDGTTTSAKMKSGACRGHGGVASWTDVTVASATPKPAASTPRTRSKHSTKSSAESATASTPSASAATTQTTGIPCGDGSLSTSKSRSGACRGHGGIAKAGESARGVTAKPTAPVLASSAAPRPTSAVGPAATSPQAPKPAPSTPRAATGSVPTGATAECKDGTYSMSKHHSGACAHHGGVSQWLDSSTSNH